MHGWSKLAGVVDDWRVTRAKVWCVTVRVGDRCSEASLAMVCFFWCVG